MTRFESEEGVPPAVRKIFSSTFPSYCCVYDVIHKIFPIHALKHDGGGGIEV